MSPDMKNPAGPETLGSEGGTAGLGKRTTDDTRYSALPSHSPLILRFPRRPGPTAPRSRPRCPTPNERAAGLAGDLLAIARDPTLAHPATLRALAALALRIPGGAR
jgi:hypothetical protein